MFRRVVWSLLAVWPLLKFLNTSSAHVQCAAALCLGWLAGGLFANVGRQAIFLGRVRLPQWYSWYQHKKSRRQWHADHKANRADKRHPAPRKLPSFWDALVSDSLPEDLLDVIDILLGWWYPPEYAPPMPYALNLVCCALQFLYHNLTWRGLIILVASCHWWRLIVPTAIMVLLCSDRLELLFATACLHVWPLVTMGLQQSLRMVASVMYQYRTSWQSVNSFVQRRRWWVLLCYGQCYWQSNQQFNMELMASIVAVGLALLLLDQDPNSAETALPFQQRIATTFGIVIVQSGHTGMTLRHCFDLSRTVAELLHDIGYLARNVGVRFLLDREGQVRRRHDLTLLHYGLQANKENQIQIVTLHIKLLGGTYIHHTL